MDLGLMNLVAGFLVFCIRGDLLLLRVPEEEQA